MSNCVISESAYRLAVKIMVCMGDWEFYSPAGHLDDKDFYRLKRIHGGQLAQMSNQSHVYSVVTA